MVVDYIIYPDDEPKYLMDTLELLDISRQLPDMDIIMGINKEHLDTVLFYCQNKDGEQYRALENAIREAKEQGEGITFL